MSGITSSSGCMILKMHNQFNGMGMWYILNIFHQCTDATYILPDYLQLVAPKAEILIELFEVMVSYHHSWLVTL